MNVTFCYPYCAPYAEAHMEGCKAITRRVKGVPTDVGPTVPIEHLYEMQANPDEGHVRVHACLKGYAKTTYVPEATS